MARKGLIEEIDGAHAGLRYVALWLCFHINQVSRCCHNRGNVLKSTLLMISFGDIASYRF